MKEPEFIKYLIIAIAGLSVAIGTLFFFLHKSHKSERGEWRASDDKKFDTIVSEGEKNRDILIELKHLLKTDIDLRK